MAEAGASGGELLFAGCASWSLGGRNKKPSTWDGVEEYNVLSFSRIRSLCKVNITNIASGCLANHSLAFANDGRGFIWGRNEHGQLGLGMLFAHKLDIEYFYCLHYSHLQKKSPNSVQVLDAMCIG